MNLCSLPRWFTIAKVKTGGFITSARVLRLWPPKCHGLIVEVGSHIIIIAVVISSSSSSSSSRRRRRRRRRRRSSGSSSSSSSSSREFKLHVYGKRQQANVRFKLRFSENRKLAVQNSSKQFFWIKNLLETTNLWVELMNSKRQVMEKLGHVAHILLFRLT